MPSRRLLSPMNCATNAFCGRSYSSDGGATCWIAPSLNTAMRSDMDVVECVETRFAVELRLPVVGNALAAVAELYPLEVQAPQERRSIN